MYFKPVTQPEPLVFDNLFTAQLLVMALAVVVLGLFPEWLIGLLYF
jgi:hypothetical protein